MKLSALAGTETVLPPGAEDIEITGLTADSRQVKPGFLFAALPGVNFDGAKFIPQALKSGAVAILLPESATVETGTAVPITHPDPRRALARFAANFSGAQPKTIVAVTGTNGKTSVASFVRQIWACLGHHAASLGTVGVETQAPGCEPTSKKLSHTTPEPVELHQEIAMIAKSGVTHLAMEASSHGLEQRRLDGICLSASAFTNISRDHLDYHKGFEDYLDQKMRLFGALDYTDPHAAGVVDADADGSETAIDKIKARGLAPFTIGESGEAIRLVKSEQCGFAQKLTLTYDHDTYEVMLPLVGGFQVSNALVAAGLAIATGGAPAEVFKSLEGLKGAKGRLEHVGTSLNGAPIFVDYAHTPDALQNALEALRPYAQGRLIIVFGCGGDRDRGKRPQMGKVAVDGADEVIVTDDNPRSEDPSSIRAEILSAAKGASEIGDRGEAILHAINTLRAGDVLLVAGKGHETGQIIGDKVIPFSDHEAVLSALKKSSKGASE